MHSIIFVFLFIFPILLVGQDPFIYFTKNGMVSIERVSDHKAIITIEQDSFQIKANIDGNRLESQLNEYESYHAILSEEWKVLNLYHIRRGNYRMDTVRIEGIYAPAPDRLSFQTEWGKLQIEIQGTQMTGIYPWFNGKIMGELIEDQFKGIWLQANRGFGTLELKFNKSFSSFEGKYNDYNYHPDEWYTWNGILIIEEDH